MDTPFDEETWWRFGVSLAIGILVGMQRETQSGSIAGVRTFALAALFGTLSGVLADRFGGLIIVGGLVAVTVTIAIGNGLNQSRARDPGATVSSGVTTEIAMLLIYLIGVWIAHGPLTPPVVVGATVFVLLYAKPQLHGWTAKLQERDWQIIARFVLVSCVILPVLPDRTFGPFDVLNPRETWFMVVLIVGMGLAGFVIEKLFGERIGIVAAGLLGGLVSSTATTVGYSRSAKSRPGSLGSATVVILLASTMVYGRLLVEAWVAAPGFSAIRLPVLLLAGLSVALCAVAFLVSRRDTAEKQESENPGQFRTAFVFAALYAIISFSSTAAKHYFGDAGMYVVGGISGLTDLDAITLSTARMVEAGKVDALDGWRVIVIAIVANLIFKAGLVLVLGSGKLFLRAGTMLLASAVFGALIVIFLPSFL